MIHVAYHMVMLTYGFNWLVKATKRAAMAVFHQQLRAQQVYHMQIRFAASIFSPIEAPLICE